MSIVRTHISQTGHELPAQLSTEHIPFHHIEPSKVVLSELAQAFSGVTETEFVEVPRDSERVVKVAPNIDGRTVGEVLLPRLTGFMKGDDIDAPGVKIHDELFRDTKPKRNIAVPTIRPGRDQPSFPNSAAETIRGSRGHAFEFGVGDSVGKIRSTKKPNGDLEPIVKDADIITPRSIPALAAYGRLKQRSRSKWNPVDTSEHKFPR